MHLRITGREPRIHSGHRARVNAQFAAEAEPLGGLGVARRRGVVVQRGVHAVDRRRRRGQAQGSTSCERAEMIDRLTDAQTAYGSVNSLNDLIEHPQLRTRRTPVGPRSMAVPANPWASEWDGESYRAAPAVDEHGAAMRAEFGAAAEDPAVAK